MKKGTMSLQSSLELSGITLGARSIIKIDVERVIDSCGYSVPKYEFKEARDTLRKWAETEGEEGVLEYQASKNTKSLDGVEGLSADLGD